MYEDNFVVPIWEKEGLRTSMDRDQGYAKHHIRFRIAPTTNNYPAQNVNSEKPLRRKRLNTELVTQHQYLAC